MIYDFIHLDRAEKMPLCTQIEQAIRRAVTEGKLPQGEKIPSVRCAAEELAVSRTTVETAYLRLCRAGYLDSRPQSGYFVTGRVPTVKAAEILPKEKDGLCRYDFSSGNLEERAADTLRWQTSVRTALRNTSALTTSGETQGEAVLRQALAGYVYAARGVFSEPKNIFVGAGTQLLLTLFCSLCPHKGTVALDTPQFQQAERIFKDYGFQVAFVDCRSGKPLSAQLEALGASVFMHIPAAHAKRTAQVRKRMQRDMLFWVQSGENRWIVEDDYNGELRYAVRPVPALQQAAPEKIVYLGSFSKLLLPSVRIAYMVLPEALCSAYRARESDYNPTVGKIEQLALAEYIGQGFLEKHLRRLRRLYHEKSEILTAAMQDAFADRLKRISVLEGSLCVVAHLETALSDAEIAERAAENGISLYKILKGHIWLNFSKMPKTEIPAAVQSLARALT